MNLIVCASPLQVLIAEKIIDEHPNEMFYGIMMISNTNSKYNYYYERLKKKCKKGGRRVYISEMAKKKSKVGYYIYYIYIIFITRIILFFYKKKIKNVFTSSLCIEILFMQIILSKIPSTTKLYTFDDGIANAYGYIASGIEPINHPLLKKLIGNNLTINKVLEKITAHYTIYPDKKNIIENIIPISLLPSNTKQTDKYHNNVSFFLGEPIYEILEGGKEEYIEIIKCLIKEYNIQYYFPHPREDFVIDGITYIHTHLVFEDYIMSNFRDNKIQLYTFYSTAAYNLITLNNIEIISFRFKEASEHKIYELFNQSNVKTFQL